MHSLLIIFGPGCSHVLSLLGLLACDLLWPTVPTVCLLLVEGDDPRSPSTGLGTGPRVLFAGRGCENLRVPTLGLGNGPRVLLAGWGFENLHVPLVGTGQPPASPSVRDRV